VTRVERHVAAAPTARPRAASASVPTPTPPSQSARSGVAAATASTPASGSDANASPAGGRSARAHRTAPLGTAPLAAVVRSLAIATAVQRPGGGPRQRVPRPHEGPGAGLLAGVAGIAGGGLLNFGFLAFVLLLVIPTAVRWLRPAVALGLSPAYVALRDRPG
jgi:hypothetical protein